MSKSYTRRGWAVRAFLRIRGAQMWQYPEGRYVVCDAASAPGYKSARRLFETEVAAQLQQKVSKLLPFKTSPWISLLKPGKFPKNVCST